MNFTRGVVYVDNTKTNTTTTPPSNNYYGYGLKNLINVLVNNIPGLSISTVTANTTTNYQVTLNYKGLLFQIRNSNSDRIYVKIGTAETYSTNYAIDSRATVTFMYSDEGVLSFSFVSTTSSHSSTVSIIPILFKLSDGTSKELFWFRSGVSQSYPLGNVPVFPSNTEYSYLIDPDDQIQYPYSISGEDAGPVVESKGKTVAVPLTFTTTYGEVVSYNVVGSSPLYLLYPGCTTYLREFYPGTHVTYVGNVPYLAITGTAHFVRM